MRRVVDTNVPMVANGGHATASVECMAACARALQAVMEGHLFVDQGGQIVTEYRANLTAYGDPRPGNAFMKWVLTNEWNPRRVTRVTLTPDGADGFLELDRPPAGVDYDRSDRVFLAVSAGHPEHPRILQALDSKWWGWQAALKTSGVTIQFLCADEIERKFKEKIGD